MTKQRFQMEHGSGAYFVIDTATRRAVATYPYGSELQRGLAYTKAKLDMQERNDQQQRKDQQA